MASNNRMWFGVAALGIAPLGSTSYTSVHGVQSFGMDTNFNLERILELSQSQIYQFREDISDVTVNVTKVLDGYPLVYQLATQQGTDNTLVGRSSAKCMMAMSLFQDTYNSASGVPQREVQLSGLFVSSFSYTANVDGNATEEVALVCNDKQWLSGGSINYTGNLFTNNDSPNAITGSGGVQRRQDVIYGTLTDTVLPTDVAGISSSGTNDQSGGVFSASVQSIAISADLNRQGLKELGRKGYYFRFVGFPVEVQTKIDIIPKSGDGRDALSEAENTADQTIKVKFRDGTLIDCGSKNRLTSINFGGLDTGGGNATLSYNYVNASTCAVSSPNDPNTAFRN